MSGKQPATRPRLTPTRIVDEALAVIDEVGLDRFSTHHLAERLAVTQPALYWHFRTKDALLAAIAERITMDSGMGDLSEGTWEDWVAERAHRYHDALLRHRDGARLVAAMREPSDAMRKLVERELEELTRYGFSVELAVRTIATISHLVTGHALRVQVAGALTESPLDPASSATFEHSLRVMIAGTRCELAAR